ncbi:MAG: hypothetical protein ACE14V_05860 [bacterium]
MESNFNPGMAGMPIAAVGFMIIWVILMGGMVIGYIFMLIALWRASKAHQAIAASVKDIAEHLKSKS